jgi:hypothetical protein
LLNEEGKPMNLFAIAGHLYVSTHCASGYHRVLVDVTVH